MQENRAKCLHIDASPTLSDFDQVGTDRMALMRAFVQIGTGFVRIGSILANLCTLLL